MEFDPKKVIAGYGIYKDKTIDELPIYLVKKIANNKDHSLRLLALLELKRRRTVAAAAKIKAIGK